LKEKLDQMPTGAVDTPIFNLPLTTDAPANGR
jgi:hypothetical protein